MKAYCIFLRVLMVAIVLSTARISGVGKGTAANNVLKNHHGKMMSVLVTNALPKDNNALKALIDAGAYHYDASGAQTGTTTAKTKATATNDEVCYIDAALFFAIDWATREIMEKYELDAIVDGIVPETAQSSGKKAFSGIVPHIVGAAGVAAINHCVGVK